MEDNAKQEGCSRKLSYQGPPISSKERTRRLSILLKHHGTTAVSHFTIQFNFKISCLLKELSIEMVLHSYFVRMLLVLMYI